MLTFLCSAYFLGYFSYAVSSDYKNFLKGKRTLPMTSECIRILTLAKEINPNGEYVFMPYGKIMLTNTFNKYLKKYCQALHQVIISKKIKETLYLSTFPLLLTRGADRI
ncbi:hypothetical protein D3Z45_09760 [Lachnospiraceae bacterium]|nr:hypothetical protein [Lachnospiraceae bacterium]